MKLWEVGGEEKRGKEGRWDDTSGDLHPDLSKPRINRTLAWKTVMLIQIRSSALKQTIN